MSKTQRINVKSIKLNAFYQMPQWLFTEDKYKYLSNDAKVSYTLIKNRYSLSIQSAENNGAFIDDEGNIYCIYTALELMDMLNLSNKTVVKVKKELINAGLLEVVKLGRGYADRLYLLDPIFEETEDKKEVENVGAVKKCKNYSSRSVKNKSLEVNEIHTNNTYINNTENNNNKEFVNKESDVTNFDSINDLEILEKEKTLEQELIDSCNKFYGEFAPGRWNKKEFKVLVNKFVQEVLEEKRQIDNVQAYVFTSLENIAYKHDLKKKKIILEPTNDEIPFYNYFD